MAMNDEKPLPLSRAATPSVKPMALPNRKYVGPEPEAAPIEEQGLGWKNTFGTGSGDDTITSGLEVIWTDKADEVEQRLLPTPV